MRKMHFWLMAAIAMALAGSGALAATSFWLSQDPVNGAPIAGDAITVASGDTATLYCFIESTEIGNTFEMMVGYDRSDAATYGEGKDGNDGESDKLELAGTNPKAEIIASINSFFDVFADPQFGAQDKAVVLDASGREESNLNIGGRPYGFLVRGAARTNAVLGKKLAFSFRLENKMTATGDSQWVVVSNQAAGKSFSSAWKYGTALFEDAYALKVVTGPASSKPVVGATNRAVLDSLVGTAASNYVWVFWGEVTVIDADSFSIDDGSGVNIKVVAPGYAALGVGNGSYVAVRGTLDVATKTLTSQQITKHN